MVVETVKWNPWDEMEDERVAMVVVMTMVDTEAEMIMAETIMEATAEETTTVAMVEETITVDMVAMTTAAVRLVVLSLLISN